MLTGADWPLSLVLDFHEVEAAGGGSGATQTSVTGLKEVFNGLGKHLSAADSRAVFLRCFSPCGEENPLP